MSDSLLGVRPLPKLGDCSRCARPAGTLAAEKYVLAGGAGQNMISFSFPACGRGNSARRALPGEGHWTERLGGPLGSFYGLPPGPAGCALPGESVGRKGGWIPYREPPTTQILAVQPYTKKAFQIRVRRWVP